MPFCLLDEETRAFALPSPTELSEYRIVVCSCSAAGEATTHLCNFCLRRAAVVAPRSIVRRDPAVATKLRLHLVLHLQLQTSLTDWQSVWNFRHPHSLITLMPWCAGMMREGKYRDDVRSSPHLSTFTHILIGEIPPASDVLNRSQPH